MRITHSPVETYPYIWWSFDCLDPQKRAAYDQHGSDPEMRSSGMPSFSRGGTGFGQSPFGGGPDGEISPEELFNMFFGGGGFGGGFGGGPGESIKSFVWQYLFIPP